MKLYLIVAKGKKQGMPIPIEFDLFVIGSSSECQLRAIHDTIGEQHCWPSSSATAGCLSAIWTAAGQPTSTVLEIPHSEEWPIHAGDVIEVGPLRLHGPISRTGHVEKGPGGLGGEVSRSRRRPPHLRHGQARSRVGTPRGRRRLVRCVRHSRSNVRQKRDRQRAVAVHFPRKRRRPLSASTTGISSTRLELRAC